jgi:hypothetical protein
LLEIQKAFIFPRGCGFSHLRHLHPLGAQVALLVGAPASSPFSCVSLSLSLTHFPRAAEIHTRAYTVLSVGNDEHVGSRALSPCIDSEKIKNLALWPFSSLARSLSFKPQLCTICWTSRPRYAIMPFAWAVSHARADPSESPGEKLYSYTGTCLPIYLT